MADILDEILAATESVRSQLATTLPKQLFSCDPEVSPRGVQDDIPFALLHNPPTYFDKPPTPGPINLPPQPVLYDHPPFEAPKWGPPANQAPPPPPTPPPPPPPPPQSAAAAPATPPPPTAAPPQPPAKRALEEAPPPANKKPKPSAAVMPPSAKSILERRERAIREGRRKDAKLTDAERRILRRLRNRESAERCRLRRVQQAAQLEKKIESMQIENDRLVAMAEEYEKTIQRLEQVIANFSKGC